MALKSPRIVEKLLALTKVTGVEVNLTDHGPLLSFCTLEMGKKSLNLLKTGQQLSPDAFLKQADFNVPMVLAFTGKSIIHKKISTNETDDAGSILQKTLPNTSADEFYVAHTEAFNGTCMATATRRASVDEVMQALVEKKADVLHIALGPFQTRAVLPVLGLTAYNTEVELPDSKVLFTDGYVSDLQHGPGTRKEYTFGDDRISTALLLSFSAAFAALSGALIQGETNLPVDALALNYRQKKIFKTGLIAAATFLFVLLLANFFAFTHFKEAKETLETRINVNKSSIDQIDTLKKELAEKELIVEKTGLLQSSRTSFYADRIASTVPYNIKLTQLTVYPQAKNGADESESTYKFKNNLIEVQGKCKYSIDVNDWINEMRSFGWAKNVKLLHYNPSNNEKGSDFVVQITL